MGAQSLLSYGTTTTHLLSLKQLTTASLFDSSTPSFLRITRFKSRQVNLASNKNALRTQVLREVSPQKVYNVSADKHLNLESRRKKLAVFVSGGGSNFKAIHAAMLDGSILGDVVVLVTNKTGCGGAAYARENGIPILQFPKTKESEGLSADDLVFALRKYDVDFILLAGYLKLIPVELVRQYPKRILNIHPSLLPAFGGKGYYGLKVHKAVIASGARYSGPTIHFVDEEYDTGRILAQRAVSVGAFDTPEELAARVLHEEHLLYVDVVKALCEDRVIWRDDGVPLIQSKEDPKLCT
ncbi:phosphoribosylglycinamide formyltransferase, chloroplastic [Silene latifolia]|uniref:phosphoribosylglycinamide formyltransferase, chloroplastic n=1 Tax=Silene latifolia TaxID=37657 RepID=UPI003D78699E